MEDIEAFEAEADYVHNTVKALAEGKLDAKEVDNVKAASKAAPAPKSGKAKPKTGKGAGDDYEVLACHAERK